MTADKRTVSTDALDTLGMIIGEGEARDAIHLAVDPAVAAERLHAGQHVGFVAGGVGPCADPVGIVDPFLKTVVEPGERFWLVVYPREITSLRHVWAHPAFDGDGQAQVNPRVESEKWLREFIARSDCPSYETVIAAATGSPVSIVDAVYGNRAYELQDFGDGDSYLYFAGRDAHGEIPPEFWDHVEIVTGLTIPSENRATGFSCSC